MHLVHNVLRTLRPLTIKVTRCKLGLKARLVARIEKLRRWPNVVVFPQCSHFAIIAQSFPDPKNISKRGLYHTAHLFSTLLV
jgi:hypothetical protein